ncbi:MAG: hydroxyphenylacetyl-CoA thioesterase PaaI [Marinovum sp.]|nr:hydroxyphenylacetyl-CoA thioesterase PaaI [Marinovum sp.]MDG1424184.1 hydroxyphenylacetyl-CoA thioesterase PaaI [Paracoccaceae bacterium]MBT4871337.1 hydroxyphenylacetyl-CoA thioesterase PaaI [Marinovum sp.]MBT6507771.1 hydroxyphenylacetyl-CoA thioesterase PaaI [Marinovum sp.]MBT6532471.1 hydroxyphenylacetyl-CoA thioesterase PaaI [Marinovum sp.]
MTPKERAEQSAEAMWASDRASQWIGIELQDIDEGFARLSLNLKAHHCNGHGIGHGGITFLLADSAFAFACNSRNQTTVAMHNMISFLNPAQEGDVLTAEAKEVTLKGKNGIYDVRVLNQHNEIVAEMRGMSRAIKGQVFQDLERQDNERPHT